MDIYGRLTEMGVELPEASTPVGMFTPVNQVGNLLYVSGQGSYYRELWIKGRLGDSVSLEEGQMGARYCILNTLAALQEYLGDLGRIKRVVKLLGFVSSDLDFHEQPVVINGASRFLLELFGEQGRHARSAIGVNTLPMDLSVEIESIFEITE